MAETSIEWTRSATGEPGYTFNPWIGCTRISPACDNCYAADWAKRHGQAELWMGERRRTTPDNWKKPLRWNRAAAAAGIRLRVFCASLADVFDNQIDQAWREDLWDLIRSTPHLDWLILTKRPQNIRHMLPADWGDRGYGNVMLGTTVANQVEADRNVPLLLSVPAKVRFLSIEPMLGPVDLKHWMDEDREDRVHWVIVGGESGPKARPMHPAWIRSLRDQCRKAAALFFFKQWGTYRPAETAEEATTYPMLARGPDAVTPTMSRCYHMPHQVESYLDGGLYAGTACAMVRKSKKESGRTIDGRIHDEIPA